jgi:NAD(P)-dependent dehydrogenase (short-subunit alcohol dehydrogenase family)
MDIIGRVVIVTGASAGIRLATAKLILAIWTVTSQTLAVIV